ncbi:MAG: hypothetical protein NXI04_19485 [Planctomycetaceae bacterium]|nr:hypothetical protein [Planctomycetaceae bacterium]
MSSHAAVISARTEVQRVCPARGGRAILALVLTVGFAGGAAHSDESRLPPRSFTEHVRPIFEQHCTGCHNPDRRRADLDLTTYRGALAGGSGGEVLKAGDAAGSRLLAAISQAEGAAAMPPDKPRIAEKQIRTIERWITAGLVESAGGASLLREMRTGPSATAVPRPKNPALPRNLPAVPLADTRVPPPVLALAASPWTNLFAASGHEQILLYAEQAIENHSAERPNSVSIAHVGTLPFPEGDVHVLQFSRSGELLLAAGGQGALSGHAVIYDVRTGKRMATLADEDDVVLSADISANHQQVAIGTPTKAVRIFSTRDGSLQHEIAKHTDWVTAVRFSPDGRLLATGDRNGGIHVWESATGGIVYTLRAHKSRVTALSWPRDGQLLISAADDGQFVVWDMKDGFPVRTASPHQVRQEPVRYTRQTGIVDLAVARDGRFVTVGRDRTLRRWKPDGTKQGAVSPLPSLPTRVVFGEDESWVVIGYLDGSLQITEISSGAVQQSLRPE